MGAFYVNYTLRGADPRAVARLLSDRAAAVSPSIRGCVVCCDELSDSQDTDQLKGVSERLSSNLKCSVLAVLNHDDDLLLYWLYIDGKLVDSYDSTPGYFSSKDELSDPKGGNSRLLCSAFLSTHSDAVERILRASRHDPGYALANFRHAELCDALGIPDMAVGMSYEAIESGAAPAGMSNEQFLRSK